MKDLLRLLVPASDSLCCVCVYWIVASTMVLADRGGVPGLFWFVLWTILSALVFARVLEKPRGFNAMFACGVGAAALGLGLLIAVDGTPVTGLRVFTLAVGAGMASGLPIYYLVKRPTVHSHLTCLDVLLLAFAWMLLAQAGQGVQALSALLVAAVLVLAVGAAVGLRMGSDSGAEGAKAMLVALAAAAVLALCVLALIAVFSRSGALTGSIVNAIGDGLGAVGRAIGTLAERFAALFDPLDTQTVVSPVESAVTATYTPAAAETGSGEVSIWLKLILAAAVLAAIAAALRILRHTSLTLDAEMSAGAQGVQTASVRASGRDRRRALRFRLAAYLHRDTPPGVLVYAERRAARRKQGRQSGETARQFLRRVMPVGTSDALADDLDRRWYGGRQYTLTAAECRSLRQKIKES